MRVGTAPHPAHWSSESNRVNALHDGRVHMGSQLTHARALEGGRLGGRAARAAPWTAGAAEAYGRAGRGFARSPSPTESDLVASLAPTRPPSRLFRQRAQTSPLGHRDRGEGEGSVTAAGGSCASPPYSMHWSGGAIELRPRAYGDDAMELLDLGGGNGTHMHQTSSVHSGTGGYGPDADLGMGAMVTVNASQVLSVTD